MRAFAFKKSFLACSLLLFFNGSVCYAAGHAYMGTTLGASFGTLSHSTPEITYAEGTVTDSYPLSDTTGVAPVWGVKGGYEFAGQHGIPAVALGVGVYTTTTGYDYDGKVYEAAIGAPGTTLFKYSYSVNSTRLMVETQLTWDIKSWLPFIDVGIGSAWTRMTDYTEISEPGIAPPAAPPFHSQTQVNFAYQVGFGLAKAFDDHRVFLGYRFASLGQTSFGTRGESYPYALKTGVLNTNDIYVGYTHLF
ncbi:MAG: outer membrane protein [Gammaproteobacteria bacterium]